MDNLIGVDLDKVAGATTEVKEKSSGERWHASDIQSELSKTKLQDDKGEGDALVLKFFDYQANPETFERHQPTAQQLLGAHLKEMEMVLWEQGLKIDPNIEPRLIFSKDNKGYRFVLGCRLARGRILRESPLTLSELANVPTKSSPN